MSPSSEGPPGRPPARGKRQWAFDVLVMLGVAATVVVRSDVPRVSNLEATVQLLMTLPLIWRRLYPSTVFAWLLVTLSGFALINSDAGPNFAILVALYTVAANQSRIRATIAAVVLDVTFIATVVPTQKDVSFFDALIFGTALTAGALGLGLWIGTRRSYLAELKDRADRLERELDQQHALAVATERGRMTREMHDIVAHHLTVVVALSDAAARTATRAPEQAAEVMQQVSATARQALTETRRVLNGTSDSAGSPDDSDGQDGRAPVPGLAGIDALLERVRAAGLQVAYEVHGGPADGSGLGSGLQLTVYRLVQEALTNTMKHAGPGAAATVRLVHGDGEIKIEIEDDGGGRPARPHPERSGGRGLTGMRERAHAYGGEVRSGPRTPCGWRVSTRLAVTGQVTS